MLGVGGEDPRFCEGLRLPHRGWTKRALGLKTLASLVSVNDMFKKRFCSKVIKFSGKMRIARTKWFLLLFFFCATFSFWDIVDSVYGWPYLKNYKSEKSEIWFKIIFRAMRIFPQNLATFEQNTLFIPLFGTGPNAERTSWNEWKLNFPIFCFWEKRVVYVLNIRSFSTNFEYKIYNNSKNINLKIYFSFVSAHSASSIKMGPFLRGSAYP